MKLFAIALLALPCVALAQGEAAAPADTAAPAAETKTVEKTEHMHKNGKHMMKHTKKTEKKDAAPADDSKM